MPYGSSIAVGTVCGFFGLATFALSGSAASRVQPTAPSNPVPAMGSATTPLSPGSDLSGSHLPPRRVPVELAANGPSRSTPGAMGAAAGVHLPIGQMVNVRFVTPIASSEGQITGLSGKLVALDDQWVHLIADGKDRLIARSQVMVLTIEPTKPAVAMIEP